MATEWSFKMREEWRGFQEGRWVNEINVRSFIHKNVTTYYGNESFLKGPTQATTDLWEQVSELKRQEIEAGGALDMDTKENCGMPHDRGWGPQCIESGWIVGEILMGLQLMKVAENKNGRPE
jgi:formate C-acetyltransferase